ncbi:MAG: ABC transporter permease [Turicibacter sp.]|nr:ABC transporter permease [Turicibacter sp.]
MSTLTKFWKIILSYKWGLLGYLAMFGGLAIAMTFLAPNPTDEAVFEPVLYRPIAIFDRDQTELTQGFIDFMDDIHIIIDLEDSYDAWLDAVTWGQAQLIIEIPAGFTESFTSDGELQLETLADPMNTAGFLLTGLTEQYFRALSTYLAGGFDIAEANVLVAETLSDGAEVELVAVEGFEFARAYLYFRMLPMAGLILVTIAMGGVFMALNKEDIIRRVESAPVSYVRRTVERIGASVLFTLLGGLVFVVIAVVMFGDQMLEVPNLVRVLNLVPVLLLGISFAFIISQFVKKREMLMSLVFPVIFGFAMPAGILFDIDMLGDQVLAVARFTPLYWYTRINEMLMWEPVIDWNLVLLGIGIQVAFAAAILAVGMVFSKEKRAKLS